DRRGCDGERLVRTSRLTARIDNNAIADGFQIYLHTFIVAANGEWAVVQQGLNDHTGMARRYHWHSASVRDFTSEPHTAIVGEPQGEIMNLVDAQGQTSTRRAARYRESEAGSHAGSRTPSAHAGSSRRARRERRLEASRSRAGHRI